MSLLGSHKRAVRVDGIYSNYCIMRVIARSGESMNNGCLEYFERSALHTRLKRLVHRHSRCYEEANRLKIAAGVKRLFHCFRCSGGEPWNQRLERF